MHNIRFVFRAIPIILILITAACNSSTSATSTPPATATQEATVTPDATAEATPESETPTETISVTPTEEVIDVGQPIEVTFISPEGTSGGNPANTNTDYSVMVISVSLENFNEALADPPAGFKWVQVDATLANQAAADPIEVTQADLFLIDTEGNRYSPEEADDFVNPPLVGQTIEPGEFFRGFARFAIPQGADTAFLEWCLDATCNEVIQTKAESK